ncbi:MAG: 5'/3'-nucleotidase SurE [Chloroflexi bacterium]|nr:5'/3'-nucleotidase SurE [Chloroflexota bacterium]
MRVLLTNDDGIQAPGLWAAAASLREVAEVTIVAPDREQSGVGTSISLHGPVRIMELPPQVLEVKTYAVEGTPSDCIILASQIILKEGIDLVVSGINQGANLGVDVLLSGTVGAAFQGHFRNLPAIAISVTALKDVQFAPAALLLRLLAPRMVELPHTPAPLLNVNLPNVSLKKLEGVSITYMGRRTYIDTVKEGDDGRRQWFWIARSKPEWEETDGSDIWAIRKKRVSITPLSTDMSDYGLVRSLEGLAQAMAVALGDTRSRPRLSKARAVPRPHSRAGITSRAKSPRGSSS